MRRRALVAALAVLGCTSAKPEQPRLDRDTGVVDAHSRDAHSHDEHDARARPDAIEAPPPSVPESLAETGLYSDFASRSLSPDVLAYDVRYPLWSDGSEKTRYLLVPAGKQIDTSDMDHWAFPLGTKAWKEFRRGGVLVETRYLEKTGEPPLGWKFVAYAWSADGKRAIAARDGVTDALGTAHDVPSQEHCVQCHSGTHDALIGVGAIQLSRESGKSSLAMLSEKGLLSTPPAREYAPPGTGVVKDTLGYLHGNCGYCHSERGVWADARKLRLRVRVGDPTPEATQTYLTTINVKMNHGDLAGEPYVGVIPGDPAKSHLYDRMIKRDFWAMPPVGSEVVDPMGSMLVKQWIESLPK